MGIKSSIEWCDSTLNLMMGCDGCELRNLAKNIKHCYAGELTDRYKGQKGYPASFEEPQLFLERLEPALKWKDLTGTPRPDKPWLNGLPRVIFLNDMGDTFTESLPIDWLAPLLPQLAASPHIFMLLTKRPSRMLEFSREHPLPGNVWPGVTVTTQKTARRASYLQQIASGGPKWISAEPMLEQFSLSNLGLEVSLGKDLDSEPIANIGMVIIGGESGPRARPFNIAWGRALIAECNATGVSPFMKQLGATIHATDAIDPLDQFPGEVRAMSQGPERDTAVIRLHDSAGADMAEWPADLRVREFTRVEVAA